MRLGLTAHAGQHGRAPHARQPQRRVDRPIGGEPDDTERRCQLSRLCRGQSGFHSGILPGEGLKLNVVRVRRVVVEVGVFVAFTVVAIEIVLDDGGIRAQL